MNEIDVEITLRWVNDNWQAECDFPPMQKQLDEQMKRWPSIGTVVPMIGLSAEVAKKNVAVTVIFNYRQ